MFEFRRKIIDFGVLLTVAALHTRSAESAAAGTGTAFRRHDSEGLPPLPGASSTSNILDTTYTHLQHPTMEAFPPRVGYSNECSS